MAVLALEQQCAHQEGLPYAPYDFLRLPETVVTIRRDFFTYRAGTSSMTPVFPDRLIETHSMREGFGELMAALCRESQENGYP